MGTTATLLPGMTDEGRKGFLAETHRLLSPIETIERMRPLMGSMGITRLANITGLDHVGVPTVVCCRPNSRSLAVSQGKGLTLDAAKASALMESVEAFHAERVSLPLKLGSMRDLAEDQPVVDVMQLPRVAGTPLSPHLHLLWVEGHDVIGGAGIWVPYEAVHINSTQQGRVNAGMLCCSSNGLASGNHPLEALSHGICEVVERDAMTLWGARGASVLEETRVDLATVDDPGCREVLDKFARAGLAVAVWDMTSDIGIPAFTCLIAERDGGALRSLHSAAGQGCHPTRGIALLRALTEAAQTRLTIIAGSRDDVLRVEYDRHRNPDQLRHTRHLLGAARGERPFQAAPDFQALTFEQDVRWEIERLRQVGVQHVVMCDLSRPALGVPVCKVVIPGLEGYNSFPNYQHGARARAVRAA